MGRIFRRAPSLRLVLCLGQLPLPEVENGAHNGRPELAKALAACRLKGATLAIAKLDRLSRDAHFLLGLEKAGVDFVAVDMRTPTA